MTTEQQLFQPENVIQVVRAILVTTSGDVLVGKRVKGDYEGGKWCLVGGKADSPYLNDELFREIEEETGVKMTVLTDEKTGTFTCCHDVKKDGKVWRNNYYIIEVDDWAMEDVLTNFSREEFSEVAWVLQEDIKGWRFAFGDGKYLRDFFKYVGK